MPWRENEILVNDQSNRSAWTDRDRWLDTEIARRKLVAGARDILLGRFSDGFHKIALAGNRQFRPDAEQYCKRHTLQPRPGVKLDLFGQSRHRKTGVSGKRGS